jgi:hypothetical protein
MNIVNAAISRISREGNAFLECDLASWMLREIKIKNLSEKVGLPTLRDPGEPHKKSDFLSSLRRARTTDTSGQTDPALPEHCFQTGLSVRSESLSRDAELRQVREQGPVLFRIS